MHNCRVAWLYITDMSYECITPVVVPCRSVHDRDSGAMCQSQMTKLGCEAPWGSQSILRRYYVDSSTVDHSACVRWHLKPFSIVS
jgi:hypothetical protein